MIKFGKKMIIIHYLGNEFIKSDSLAILTAKSLVEKYKDEIKFEKIDSFDDMIDFEGKKYFMDVAQGIDKVRLITDITEFEGIKSATAHDIDFSFFLQLSHKLGKLDELKIICLPQKTYKELDIDVCIIIDNIIGVNK